MPVFGLLKRGGKVHAIMIDDTRSTTLSGIIRQHVQPHSLIYTDAYRSYVSWMCRSSGTAALTTASGLSIGAATSMASRISGTRPSAICVNLMVFRKTIFRYF